MCNRYANRVSYRGYIEELSETRLPLVRPGPDRAPNLEPRDNIRPTDRGHVLLPAEGGLELREMRWGLIPWFHKRTVKEWKVLTTNARSETIETIASYKAAFAERRCLIPVSAFYESTGDKSPKTKWHFTLPGAEWFCFAGIWDRAHTADGAIESYALTTLPPDPAFEQYHDRGPLVLERGDYAAWLDSPESAKALFTAPRRLPLSSLACSFGQMVRQRHERHQASASRHRALQNCQATLGQDRSRTSQRTFACFSRITPARS